MLVQLFWVFFVLPEFGLTISPMTAAIVVLGLNFGAFGAEIVRGVITDVPRGQGDAASALRSFTHWQRHLDEVFVKINGETRYLWRAVDHEGEVLEAFVSKRRDRKAASKFLRKLLKRHGRPEVIVTDKLQSYGAAMRDLGNVDRQQTGQYMNNRGENSHLPLCQRRSKTAPCAGARVHHVD